MLSWRLWLFSLGRLPWVSLEWLRIQCLLDIKRFVSENLIPEKRWLKVWEVSIGTWCLNLSWSHNWVCVLWTKSINGLYTKSEWRTSSLIKQIKQQTQRQTFPIIQCCTGGNNFWVCNSRGCCYVIVYGLFCKRKESTQKHTDPGHENWPLLLARGKRP